MLFRSKKFLLGVLAASCLLLAGCSFARLEVGDTDVSKNTENISAVISADEINKLDELSNLRVADLSGSTCYEEIMLWAEEHPDVYVHYTVQLPCGTVIDSHSSSASVRIGENTDPEEVAVLLNYLPQLESLELTGDNVKVLTEALEILAHRCPDIKFESTILINGKNVSTDSAALSLSHLSREDIERLVSLIPAMYNLESLDLGSDTENPELTFTDIKRLQTQKPDAEYLYDFTIYDRAFSLSDTEMDLSYTDIYDGGELVRQVIACMPDLKYLDMDSCGVSNEDMASIRDDFPHIKVVWRVWFGVNYCVRTDVETILASRPSIGGNLTGENAQALKYCTEVKYLDVGHNEQLDDISFISYMPDLEVAILAMGIWSDTSPIASCPNLEYLEIQTTTLTDLTPLSGLTKLKHLNICYLFELDDITPLYPLTQLERLWIGCLDPVPQEQVDEMQRRAPQCVINTTTYDPTDGGWRYRPDLQGGLDPRYALLIEQFGYNKGNASFAFSWNDPTYHKYR